MSRRHRPQGTRPSRRRRASGGASGLQKILYALLIVVSVAALGGFYWLSVSFEEPTLDEALCPETGATGQTVVLLDLTDPVTTAQAMQIRREIMSTIDAAPIGTLFALGIVHPDEAERGVRFKACKPLAGQDANELIQNPRMVAERYEERFVTPLDATLDEMLDLAKANSSPIMESLQAIVGALDRRLVEGGGKTIILATDLIQHSEIFSFFRRQTWQTFEQATAFRRLARNLNGYKIKILRLPREAAAIDRSAVDDFWVRYFEAQGADRVSVHAIGDL